MNTTRTLTATGRAALAGAAATGLTFLLAWSWAGATHSPAPHHVPVAITAPATTEHQLSAALAPAGFTLVPYSTEQQAATAVRHGDVAGAVIINGSGQLDLLTASAGGPVPAQVLTETFQSVAAADHAAFTATDLVPLPAGDRLGATGFLLVLATLIGALAVGAALGLAGPALTRTRLALTATGYAIATAAAATLLADAGLGALTGHVLPVLVLLALLALAVTLPVAAATRRAGVRALPAAALLLLGLGIPATGLPAGLGSFTPSFYHWLAPVLPNSATVYALRDSLYFGGTHLATPFLSLACWIVAGLIILVIPARTTAPAAQTSALALATS